MNCTTKQSDPSTCNYCDGLESNRCRVQLPGREPSRFPRFPFLVPTQKRETDRETPETGRKRRKPPGFPFPDFTGKLLPDGKLNPGHNSQEPDEACSACMHAGTGCLAGRVAGSRFMPSTSRARKHSVDGPLVFPSLFFFPLPPERVRTTPNLYVFNGQRRELLREEGTEDKL